jgi:tRNA 5-methylaminomethyl-2-thiouridine biosynthesis bifunctional protein
MSGLAWLDGQPFSPRYGDVYFSRESGLAETRHVFLHGNRLEARFAALSPRAAFTIAETGFGTGLNFLCAWQAWREHAPQGARLDYVSVEKHPLDARELAQTLALWPQLAPLAAKLLARYHALTPGWNRLDCEDGVRLTLLVGDALESLAQARFLADAWFLDGFSPARNPAMWQPALFHAMARLCAPGASFATFTSAGAVRRGLGEAGFAVEKIKGFGKKRDMLAGRLAAPPQAPWNPPWYANPAVPGATRAIVVGGGIAGAASAHALARRGLAVTLVERHAALAQEGSGNSQGILYAKLSPHAPPLSRLTLAGYGHTLRLLRALSLSADDASFCGVLQLAPDETHARRQAALAERLGELVRVLDSAQASRLAGMPLPAGGLCFPDAGWIHPPAAVRALATSAGIGVRQANVTGIAWDEGEWRVFAAAGEVARAPVLVLATAGATLAFPPAAHLPLQRNRGQISVLPATPQSEALATVLCGEGYVAPPRPSTRTHTLGATYAPFGGALEPTAADHAENLAKLRALCPALAVALDAAHLSPQTLAGRAALRAVTPDRLPLVGALADANAFRAAYALLARDAKARIETPAPWLPGLYVNAGHGSRGLLSAPLAGEIIADLVSGAIAPVENALLDACQPNRFLLRALSRQR